MNENTNTVSYATKKGRAALLTALILALALIAVNVLVSHLRNDVKTLDLTQNKMYSVTDSTKRDMAKVEEPVSISLVSVNGETSLADEGIHLHTFLGNLAAVNKNITYSIIDPAKDTTTIENYSFASEIGNLSVVVESERRAYHIPYSDFFGYYVDGVGIVSETDAMYYYYYYGVTPYYCFSGESLLLSAVSYVTKSDLPTIYALTGHSEGDVASNAATMLGNLNVDVTTLSLSSGASVPADCDLLIINAPQTDITASEAALLCNYLEGGGAILLTTTPEITSMLNLGTVTTHMFLHGTDGIVTEDNSQQYYNDNYPYYLMPIIGEHEITETVSSVLLPFAHGIGFSATLPAGTTVTPILSTSESAYVIPLDASTPEKPEGAVTDTFCVGAVSESAEGGKLIWIPCTNFLSDTADNMISGGNSALLSACVTWVCGETTAPPTASVLPLVTETLTVGATTANLLSFMLVVIVPATIVAFGIFCIIRRKKR